MKERIKKTSVYLLIISLLINNLSPIIMVLAQSEGVSVDILSLYQNVNGEKVELEQNENIWELQSLNKVEVKCQIEGLSSEEDEFFIRVYPNQTHEKIPSVTNGENSFTFIPNAEQANKDYEYTIIRKNEYGLYDELVTGYIKTNYSEYKNFLDTNPNLEITGILQGGKEVSKEEDEYIVNDQQDIEIRYKGLNFSESFNYNVKAKFSGSDDVFEQNLTKEDIEQEQTLVIKTKQNLSSDYNYINLTWGIITEDGISKVKEQQLYLRAYTDDNLPEFKFGVAYKNFDDKIINHHEAPYPWPEASSFHYKFDIRKYNADNPLIINITGSEFLNQDYEVNLSFYNGETKKEVYTKKYNVNGKNLNNVFTIIIDDFVPTWDKFDIPHYIEIEINSTTKSSLFSYRDIGTIVSELYYANGMKNTDTRTGDGSYYYSSIGYYTSMVGFNNENPLEIIYKGYDFDENTTYTYELSYSQDEEDIDGSLNFYIVDSGSFIGKNFNENGFTQQVPFQENKISSVKLDVFNGNNLVYVNSISIGYSDDPVLANIQLKSYNNQTFKEQHIGYGTYYVSTNNEPLKIEINGLGFEDDKVYNYTMRAMNIIPYEMYDGSEITGTLKGSDINNRKAIIQYDKLLNYTSDYVIEFEIEEVYVSSSMWIEIVKSKQYLENGNSYSVDNIDGFIKGAFYEKNPNTLLNEINIKNNHTTKIFTKDGIEASGAVATGMLARIYDSNGVTILDIPIVIKGDITGTGNITLTDTVKMKRAVAGLETPTGVYASASDINDDGKITLTDAIKVTRHFAGIEEIK